MEDTKKRNDFTVTHQHHSKLFLPADLVKRDDFHKNNSNNLDAITKSIASEAKSIQQQKNSERQKRLESNLDSQKGIDTDALKEIKKAAGNVTVLEQRMALLRYEEEQKKKLSQPKGNKEKVDQQRRINKAKNELKLEDWSSLDDSLLDIEKQKKLLEEATHNKQLHEEKKAAQLKQFQEEIAQQEEKKKLQEVVQQKRLQEQKRAEEAVHQRKLQESAQQNRMHDKVVQRRISHEETPHQNKAHKASKNKDDDNDSQSEEYFDPPDYLPDKPHSPADLPFSSFDPNHFASEQHDTPVITMQPRSVQNFKPSQLEKAKNQFQSIQKSPNPQPSNDNPYNLEKGSMIQFGNPPCYGVIKWIGDVPETNCTMAGVEVVSCVYNCDIAQVITYIYPVHICVYNPTCTYR